ncbi:Crp/Fnr family transcriptional regulator [Sphingobacterium sp. CZ-2]|uniref:Crp/Fnr family transcriptional regulator n=1 Tax=Sphingobacterium sp. CZ-2 TaxID=2557994 RepID=UPI00106FA36D|nr:Crp/Fnr family transcriptional regulator [Sphingobacterium sp. CZ-2]QBR13777.1 Crp/Fnr family transcriptional regulator [Sphingobacterium sp. CZ-2]
MTEEQLKGSNFYRYYSEKAGLTDADFQALQPYYELKELSHNQYVMRSGEVCRSVLFVEEGLLQFLSLDEKGGEHILQFAPENWLISDRSSMYFDEPSLYFIKAIEPSKVVFIHPNFFTEAGKLNFDFSMFTERSLQRSIYYLQKRINSLLAMTAKERYLEFMELYPSLLLRVPQWMIASYLGITPESLSRVRREIAKDSF